MKFAEASGKTVDIAVENGLKELGLTKDEVDIEVLAQGGGLLKKARVRLTKKKTPGEKALAFIEGLLEAWDKGDSCVVEMTETNEESRFNIIGTDTSVFIGYHGEVLDSIQYIASVLANNERAEGEYRRIAVDTEGYRAKREQTLIELAHRLAEKADKIGRKVALEPMNPAERRIIHAALGENKTVTTTSEGREPDRYVVIIPKNLKHTGGGDRDRGDRSDRRDDRRNEKDGFGKPKKPFKGKRFGYNKKK